MTTISNHVFQREYPFIGILLIGAALALLPGCVTTKTPITVRRLPDSRYYEVLFEKLYLSPLQRRRSIAFPPGGPDEVEAEEIFAFVDRLHSRLNKPPVLGVDVGKNMLFAYWNQTGHHFGSFSNQILGDPDFWMRIEDSPPGSPPGWKTVNVATPSNIAGWVFDVNIKKRKVVFGACVIMN